MTTAPDPNPNSNPNPEPEPEPNPDPEPNPYPNPAADPDPTLTLTRGVAGAGNVYTSWKETWPLYLSTAWSGFYVAWLFLQVC